VSPALVANSEITDNNEGKRWSGTRSRTVPLHPFRCKQRTRQLGEESTMVKAPMQSPIGRTQ
jgi:hypothetical protein